MKAFDKLPKRLREAIAASNTCWAVQPIRTMFERGATVDKLAADIRRWDMMERAAIRMKKVWGPGHPQAISAKPKEISKRLDAWK